MATRGTVNLQTKDGSYWFLIASDAGAAANRRLLAFVRWANHGTPLPRDKLMVLKLQTYKGAPRFEPTSKHPFDEDATHGRSSPFNEYEYTIRYHPAGRDGSRAGYTLLVEENVGDEFVVRP